LQLLGVDAAAGMIEVARTQAAAEGLANVRFEVMPSESLAPMAAWTRSSRASALGPMSQRWTEYMLGAGGTGGGGR